MNNTTTDDTPPLVPPPQWMLNLDIFSNYYYPPIIIIIGTVGNVLMFMLMNMNEFRQTPSSVYMRGIAITDSVYLISRLGQRFLFTLVPWLLLSEYQTPICMEFYILFTFGQAASLLLLVAMSFNRAMAILCPMTVLRGNALKKAKIHACVAVGLAFGYSLGFNLSRSYIPHLRQEGWPCPYYFHPPYDIVITHVESALGYSCLLVMIFTNVLIIFTILKSRKQRAEMQSQQKQQSSDDDNHMLIMLLLVSVSYLIAYLLPRMKNAYYFANPAVTPLEKHVSNSISTITVMIEHGNFALNFYLFCLPLSKFRNAVLVLVGLRARPTRDGSNSSVVSTKA